MIARKLGVSVGITVTKGSRVCFHSIIVPPLDLFFMKGSSGSAMSSEFSECEYSPFRISIKL